MTRIDRSTGPWPTELWLVSTDMRRGPYGLSGTVPKYDVADICRVPYSVHPSHRGPPLGGHTDRGVMTQPMSYRSSLLWAGEVSVHWRRWIRAHWRMTL